MEGAMSFHKSIKLTKTEREVLRIIRQDESYAADDTLLITRIWSTEGWNKLDDLYINLARVTDASTIKRARRHLFQLGLIVYPEAVLARRNKSFLDQREKYSSNQWFKKLLARVK